MAMKHYEPGKPYHRPGQKKRKKNLRPLLALLALLVVLGLAVGLVFAWLNRHKAQVPEDVAPIVTEAPAAPTATPEPTAEPTPEPTAEPLTFSWDTTGEEGNPYLIAVNRTTQTVTVYEKDEEGNYTVPFKSMICSTGRDTPVGFFHTSNQYDWWAACTASMPPASPPPMAFCSIRCPITAPRRISWKPKSSTSWAPPPALAASGCRSRTASGSTTNAPAAAPW